jgi:hypothetical protein
MPVIGRKCKIGQLKFWLAWAKSEIYLRITTAKRAGDMVPVVNLLPSQV